MKKLILLFAGVSILSSCSIEDEPNVFIFPAEVVETNLPESFQKGKIYTIEVNYVLPDACHLPAGLQVNRKTEVGAGRRDIYVMGVVSAEEGRTCNLPDSNLEKKGSFKITIDEDDAYTFYLWTGLDENEKSIYTEVEVPVEVVQTQE